MRLSNFTPFLILVDPIVALSIVVLAPISTLSSITTLPICIIFVYWFLLLEAKPNPSAPITDPDWSMQPFPTIQLFNIFTPEYKIVLSPTILLSPI